MKFGLKSLVVGLLVSAISVSASAADVEARLNALEAQNRKLQAEVSALRGTNGTAPVADMSGTKTGGLMISVAATGVFMGAADADDAGLSYDINMGSFARDNAGSMESSDKTDATVSYDLEISSNIGEKGLAYSLIEAGAGDGLDGDIATYSGLNDDADADNRLHLTELWYKHLFMDDKLEWRIGLLDPTSVFDGNAYANDETTQFLSGGFVNAHNVDWTDDNSIGTDVTYTPNETVALKFGIYDGDADLEAVARDIYTIAEVDFKTNFCCGKTGTYRFYGWYNNEVELVDYDDGDNDAGWGFGISFDQMVTDTIGLFARYSYADEDVYQVEHTWSVGGQLLGTSWNRCNDNIGLAVGGTILGDDYEDSLGAGFDEEDEIHLELYYRYQVNDNIAISPDVQVIWNSMCNDDNDTFATFGIRGQLDF